MGSTEHRKQGSWLLFWGMIVIAQRAIFTRLIVGNTGKHAVQMGRLTVFEQH
jgi:hypothetical protein